MGVESAASHPRTGMRLLITAAAGYICSHIKRVTDALVSACHQFDLARKMRVPGWTASRDLAGMRADAWRWQWASSKGYQ